ncbi:hypothetical protein E2C01_097273 [Portunus trituberculatus]|uniref:Uncharacterized protein n=1 Tax=Portunus trituberculatus TaxID=210409 RepID=A0A5B7K004_PORTR|nr:hypothetical protein [Portunus trituberculatus]
MASIEESYYLINDNVIFQCETPHSNPVSKETSRMENELTFSSLKDIHLVTKQQNDYEPYPHLSPRRPQPHLKSLRDVAVGRARRLSAEQAIGSTAREPTTVKHSTR